MLYILLFHAGRSQNCNSLRKPPSTECWETVELTDGRWPSRRLSFFWRGRYCASLLGELSKEPWRDLGSPFRAGIPGGSGVKNPPAMQEMWVWSLGWDDSLEKEIANPLRLFSPGKSHGQRNLVPTVHGVSKESNTTLRLNNSNSEQDLESWGSWKCHRGDFFIWEQLMGYGLMSQVCQFLRQRAFKRMPFKRMRWSHTLEFLLSILSKESKLKKKNTKTSW